MADKKNASGKLHPKLEKLVSSVTNRMAIKDVFVTASGRQECINTGSTVINLLIGGSRLGDGSFVCPGWPRGGIVEIFGRESSGKSTLALTATGQALAEHDGTGTGLYVDLEYAVKDNYAKKLGVDFRPPHLGGHGRALRATPHTFEETEAIVNNAALNGVDIIVIDSVAGLVSKREWQRDVTDPKEKQGVAEIPRLMSSWLPKLQGIIARTKTTVIFLNQMRAKIGYMGHGGEEFQNTTTGGNTLRYYAALRVFLQPRQVAKAKRWNPLTKENEDVPIATDVIVKMAKNKIDARQGHTGLVTIRYGIGIDELRTTLNIAEAYGIVKVSKNGKKQDVYRFKSPTTGEELEETGIEKFRFAISTPKHAGMYEEMSQLCTNKLLEGFKAIDDKELAQLAEDAVVKSFGDPDGDDYEDGPAPVETEAKAGVDYDDITSGLEGSEAEPGAN